MHRRLGHALPLLLALQLLAPRPASAAPSCGTGGPTGQTTGSAGAGTYEISVPAAYDPGQAIPLLLALHGDEGTPDYIYSVFRGLQQDTQGAFILVAPKAPAGGGSWYQATGEHVQFIDAVLDKLLTSYNIDQDRIWITGWSGGATFLSYYAIKRQDVLAAVVFHLGGGGGGSYAPPPGSCKLPARWVIGDQDFLYDLARDHYELLQQQGHEVEWVELPGVGHDFEPSTLPATWSWLGQHTLCGTTVPGTCDGSAPPDSGGPGTADAGATADSGQVTPPGDASPLGDAGVPPADGRIQLADASQSLRIGPGLVGGCAVPGDAPTTLPPLVLCLGLALALRRRRRR